MWSRRVRQVRWQEVQEVATIAFSRTKNIYDWQTLRDRMSGKGSAGVADKSLQMAHNRHLNGKS